MPHSRHYKRYQWILTLLMIVLSPRSDAAPTDAELLLKFKSSLSNATALSDWNPAVPLCNGNKNNWSGLTCMDGNLYGLRLENMGLWGTIDVDTLSQLSNLRSLSVMYNNFRGTIPQVGRLGGLRALFLSDNGFSGEIPDDAFKGMKYLKKVYLARNEFGGRLPKSLAGLSKLIELDVESNQLGGSIPDFEQGNWRALNFSNNRFKGRIPASLSKIDRSAFLGNSGLCGAPLDPCKASNKTSITITIAVSVAAIITVIALIILFLRTRRAQSQDRTIVSKQLGSATKAYKKFAVWDTPAQSPDYYKDNKKGDRNGTLHFVRDDREKFELEDLLRASAEVLGSGSFGSSYKAVLLSGPALVVKRFRNMNNVGREEFHAHMARLGRLSHPNLLPIVAYYHTKEEKLLISDFVENGSLASHLHGKRPAGQQGLDWPTRLNIIKGVARGLSYLYRELPNQTLPHGHLKSSNVLLDRDLNPVLSEYALSPLLNTNHAHQFMAAYKSPEFSPHRDHRPSKKADVWSLGILIFELLTGKFPANYLKPGKRGMADLAAWVNSVVREEWTGEVFDKDMRGTRRGEGEMLKLLKIGLCCCEGSVERRWDWRKAVEKIEELKKRDNEGEDYSSYVTDWDVYSSMVLSDEDFSFSVEK